MSVLVMIREANPFNLAGGWGLDGGEQIDAAGKVNRPIFWSCGM